MDRPRNINYDFTSLYSSAQKTFKFGSVRKRKMKIILERMGLENTKM
jgi:hypothetical protein